MSNITSTEIRSVDQYVKNVRSDTLEWKCSGNDIPWFRGQDDCEKDPIPKLFRDENYQKHEFSMNTTFRNRAPTLKETPERGRLDEWLYLMQHFGLPTRLLDWTESSLMALFFAVYEIQEKGIVSDPCVWMIHPIELNKMARFFSVKRNQKININTKYKVMKFDTERSMPLNGMIIAETNGTQLSFFPNTWVQRRLGINNFQYAFATNDTRLRKPTATKYPIAIQPTYIHIRMLAQKSCFTIHGLATKGFEALFNNSDLVKNKYFRKYIIKNKHANRILIDLKTAGITNSTVFPDFEGLAKELKGRF